MPQVQPELIREGLRPQRQACIPDTTHEPYKNCKRYLIVALELNPPHQHYQFCYTDTNDRHGTLVSDEISAT